MEYDLGKPCRANAMDMDEEVAMAGRRGIQMRVCGDVSANGGHCRARLSKEERTIRTCD